MRTAGSISKCVSGVEWTLRAARAGGPRLVGYYHSHPTGAPEPSATDRAQAAHDGRVWAIAAEGEVRFWRDDETGFVPLSYTAIIG